MVKIEKQVVWGRGATVGIKEVKTESRAGDVHCVTFHLGRKSTRSNSSRKGKKQLLSPVEPHSYQ